MSLKTMDGLRMRRVPLQTTATPSRQARTTKQTLPKVIFEYPDLSPLLAPDILQPDSSRAEQYATTQSVETRAVVLADQHPAKRRVVPARQRSPKRLRVVRKSILRSGVSWFLLCAVLSASAIGLFSVFENGRAAKEGISNQAASAEQALSAAAAALASKNPEQALAEFDKATSSFEEIRAQVDSLSATARAAAALLPGDPLASADILAQAGVHVATAGRALTSVVTEFSGVILGSVVADQIADTAVAESSDAATSKTLTDVLVAVQPEIEIVGRELTEAGRLILTVDVRGLPSEVAEPVAELQQQLPGVLTQLRSLGGLVGVLAEVAGATKARTYAVVFQNPNELRPTGGFWGQIAFVKLQHGKVEKLDIKSIYDPAGQVQSLQKPPEGLDVISESFAMQDANWYADFATSARVLLGFLSETGDPRLDGVIALNPRVVTDLLALTGPIEIDPLNLSVNEDNFVEEAQYEVPDKDPTRDQEFFPEFTQQFLSRLFALDRDHWLAVAGSMMTAVERKDIQIFFGDAELASLPEALGVDGTLGTNATEDIVAPVFANVGGGKTDQYAVESRALKVTIGPEFVRHELEITRRDTRTDQFKDRANRSYLRVYVPAGAKLREASGFDTDVKALLAHDCTECQAPVATPLEEHTSWEPTSNTKVYQESGRSVFANWVTLLPGEERTMTLVYDIPRGQVIQDGQLHLNIWRQPGSAEIPFDLEVTSQSAEQIEFVSGATRVNTGAGELFVQKLVQDRDHVVGVVLQ